jgi:hypothetical protein
LLLKAVTGKNDANGNTAANSSIKTGDAMLAAIVQTTVNNVTVATSGGSCCGTGSSSQNIGNGSGSTNKADTSSASTSTTNINNDATVKNGVNGYSISGKNDASYNTGGDSEIITGDANALTTIITDANAVNMGIYQFDINGNQTGDIILNQDPSKCINCASTTSAINKNNGADSTNDASAQTTNTNTETINNNGDVINDINIKAISGKNDANYNTNGDSIISTGDANVVANVINSLNTVVDGVIYTVNILGDMVGNILLPSQSTEMADCGCCGSQDVNAQNIGNGSDSQNLADATQTNTNTNTQINSATIDNNLYLDANTGDNEVNFNTNGNSIVETGDVSIDANVINVANVNVSGGPCDDPVYMVFINDPYSNWQGQIAGAAPGTYFYTSDGLIYVVEENGQLTAVNIGNGADSTNTANAASTNTNTTTITNDGTITNNINIQANTGDNSASYNTGGDSSIKTGDANIMLNVVNFINSNFSGRKVVMTLVNIFGSWIGHFVPPGYAAPADQATNNSTPSSSHGGTGGSSNSSSSSSNNGGGSLNSATSVILSSAVNSPITGLVSGFRTQKTENNDNSDSLALATTTYGSGDSDSGSSLPLKTLIASIPFVLLLYILIRRYLIAK